MTRCLMIAVSALAWALPAAAQEHAEHAPPADTVAAGATGADQPVGNESPPSTPGDHAADRYYSADAMAPSRAILDNEHGGTSNSMLFARIAEYQARDGKDGYHWDGAAWFGGDMNRLVLKTEGEGDIDASVETAEVQALYSRAIGPYTDLQVGLRQDIEPHARTYAAFGVEALLPYWFDVGAALFLSDEGQLLGRVEGEYALRLTQRLVLEPRAELNLAAEDDLASRIGAGLSDGELGLRLRYEIRREFAPYVGIVYERKFGDTADMARAASQDVETTSFVAGLRAWY